MTNRTASLEYRRAATQQSSVVGLVVALHDTLIGNLTRAAQAIDSNDIQVRCDQLVHGFKVLQQLEAMLDMENGGDTAINARRFYTHVRGQMLAAQFKVSAETLYKVIRVIFEIRQAWQQLDSSPLEVGSVGPSACAVAKIDHSIQTEARLPFSCSG